MGNGHLQMSDPWDSHPTGVRCPELRGFLLFWKLLFQELQPSLHAIPPQGTPKKITWHGWMVTGSPLDHDHRKQYHHHSIETRSSKNGYVKLLKGRCSAGVNWVKIRR